MVKARVDLRGKVVAITGGARGIGLEIARACASAGMTVRIADLDADAVRDATAELGGGVSGRVLDVRNALEFAEFLDSTEPELGALDVLVNNAGVLRMRPLVDTQPYDIRLQLDVNLAAVITGTQLALQRFVVRGSGHIVNMASRSSMVATANGAVSTASKYGVLGFTRAVRGELRDSNVRITAVLPGVIRTRMTREFGSAFSVRTIEPSQTDRGVSPGSQRSSAMEDVAEKFDLRSAIRFGSEVTRARFDPTRGCWSVTTADGERTDVDVLIPAVGQLSRPALPNIPGRDTFAEPSFHSAQWDHTVSLEDKRVAVIGSGASAIQFIPEIQPAAGRLLRFQRTPPYLLPRPDGRFGATRRWLFAKAPITRRMSRFAWYSIMEPLGGRTLSCAVSGWCGEPRLPYAHDVSDSLGARPVREDMASLTVGVQTHPAVEQLPSRAHEDRARRDCD